MPYKSKIIEASQTQVKKKTKDDKKQLVTQIKRIYEDFKNIYVLYYKNESTAALNTLRTTTPNSKFSFASNAILKLALGLNESEELDSRTHLLSKIVQRKSALMFTNLKLEEVRQALKSASQAAFLQGGQVATQTISIPAGALNKDFFAGPLEPELRRLGMPTKLVNEVIEVESNFKLCSEGEIVTGAQAALLRHFGYQLAEFEIEPICAWLYDDKDIMLLKDEFAELLD